MNPDACQAATSRLKVPEIVTLPAEIDITNAVRVSEGLRAALVPGVFVLIADMTRTLFCDSAGIQHLLIAHDLAAASQAELRVVIESPAVLRIVQMTGVDQILSIYPSLQAALADGHPAGKEASRPDASDAKHARIVREGS